MRALRNTLYLYHRCCLYLFFALTLFVYNNPLLEFDINASQYLQSQGWASPLRYTNAIFGAPAFRLIYLVLIAAFVIAKRYALIVFVVISAASEILTFAIKNTIARPRPTADLVTVYADANSFSFISGHTLEHTLLFGFLGYLALVSASERPKRYILTAILFIMPLIVGLGRVYAGVHWLTDIIGSYLLGAIILLALLTICKGAFEPKRRFR